MGKDKQTNRILLITLSNIGDLVMTTPVMESLHTHYPNALIDIVGDRRSSHLLQHCPYLGTLIHRDKEAGWSGTWKLIRRLRQRRYDLVVDLRTDGLAWLLRAGSRLTRLGRRRTTGHTTERHMAILSDAIAPSCIPPPRVWLSAEQLAHADTAIAGLPGQRWLAIGPGANWEPKRWPVSHFRELLRQLDQAFDAVVCLGSKTDYSCCQEILAGQSIHCLNLAGSTTLLEAAAVLGYMRVFIGNDSGLGHIAAAMATPTLTVFGPGDPERYHPWGSASRWLQSASRHIEDVVPADVAALSHGLLSATADRRVMVPCT